MKTRMQPIGTVWTKFPRVVRDLAMSCGKQVRLEMEGEDTELDRTILEAIKDPLTHLVRNAVDHGIETPEQRRAAGQAARRGCCSSAPSTRAARSTSRSPTTAPGIDPARVRAKAVERGLVTADQAARMARPRAPRPHLPAGLLDRRDR